MKYNKYTNTPFYINTNTSLCIFLSITAMTVRQILDDAGKESDVSLSIKQLTLYSYKKEHKIQVVFGKKHLLKNKGKLRKLNSKLLPPACSSQ